MASPKQERTVNLVEYYHILLKHKWLILATLILLSGLTAVLTFQMKPVYRTTCIMVIEKERTTSPLTGERVDLESIFSQSLSYSTHAKLIQSRPVILRVIRKLRLDKLEPKNSLETSPIRAYIAGLKQNIRILLGQPKKEPTPDQKLERLIKRVNKKIRIEPVKDTHLLNISAEDHDPDLAGNIANAVAESYIEFNLDNRISSSKNTLSWMTNQLYATQKKLEDAEEEFLAFKQREKLFSLEGKQEGIAGKINNQNDIYIKTRNQRVEVETKLKELARADGTGIDALHVRTLINNQMIDNLYSQMLKAEIELSRLGKVYKSKHPKIIQVKSSIENAREKFRGEIQKEVKNLKAELAVLTQKEEALKKSIEDFESDALATNSKELKYNILQRNVDTHQKLYNILLDRIKESDITGDIDVSNIRIAETAVIPPAPIKPNKSRNMALSIIFGLMTGIGLAFLWEYFDKSLRTEEDIINNLDLPVLAIIPEAEKEKYQQQKAPTDEASPAMTLSHRNKERSARVANLRHIFLVTYPNSSSFAEAYRALRTNIHFSLMDKRLRSLLLTSTIDEEGKTVTAANTAYSMAQSGQSVLMIDADLRKPTLSALGPSSKSLGLTGLLSGVFSSEVNNGSLAEFQIGDLFRLLSMQKKTGILSLTQEKENIDLLFFQGKMVDLNWVTRPEDEKFAAVLISNRMITREQAKQAFAQQKATGQKLGFILLQNGYLKKEDLAGPLTIHIMEGLRKALGFNSGDFSFEGRSESDFEPIAFDPVDFNQIYKQLIIGDEPVAYLQKKINEAIIETHVENLFLLPSGTIPPNPSELLSSDRMAFLLSILEKRFDLIVIDSPPIIPASDALLIASHVDGVLLVLKAGRTNRDLVINAVGRLQRAQVNILGVALNSVNIKKSGYYKTYFKNYAKYYEENA